VRECIICKGSLQSSSIPVCPKCAKERWEVAETLHEGLELIGRGDCGVCSNMCGIEKEGLCRIRYREGGIIRSRSSRNRALLHAYFDPLPTNCCNSWFCRGSRMRGFNLAVFYYGCNFDCLYCQNWSHKNVGVASSVGIDELLSHALRRDVKCICHFGGSPEPQIGFALNFSRKVLEKREDIMICWEWNGAGKKEFALRAAELSHTSNGTVKFDLKAWNENLHRILTGRSNKPVLRNFSAIFDRFPEVISATTLLVPYYVDEEEVERIAEFIASHDTSIPYSLLVFHPDYRLTDLPVTPKEQVFECYKKAKKHLKNVSIGNLHLLGGVLM